MPTKLLLWCQKFRRWRKNGKSFKRGSWKTYSFRSSKYLAQRWIICSYSIEPRQILPSFWCVEIWLKIASREHLYRSPRWPTLFCRGCHNWIRFWIPKAGHQEAIQVEENEFHNRFAQEGSSSQLYCGLRSEMREILPWQQQWRSSV